MSIIRKLDEEQWQKWLDARPQSVKDLAAILPPDRLYRFKNEGNRATIYSYCEDGTVTVNVTGQYNLVTFDRQVFGVKPEDLEECDPPENGELLGTIMKRQEDVEECVKFLREKLDKGE